MIVRTLELEADATIWAQTRLLGHGVGLDSLDTLWLLAEFRLDSM